MRRRLAVVVDDHAVVQPDFLGWVLDEANAADEQAVLTEMPPPARIVYDRIVRPRYSSNHHRERVPA